MTGQFLDFYTSLDPDPLKRGKQFEHFVKWFLKADPEWATQVEQVWLWEEWPQRWGADCGIDLVFRHKNGDHWAVQAKCYSPDYDITKHDVDKFLSESNRPLIQHRLLIATTDRIGANARQVCDAQDKPVVRFLLSDFDKSALDYPANFAALPQAKRKPRPTPKEHQLEAIEAVVQGLKSADRGQLIMACGTGKTYTTLWIKEKLLTGQALNSMAVRAEPDGTTSHATKRASGQVAGYVEAQESIHISTGSMRTDSGINSAGSIDANRTLVLLPSLGLLAQTLREWTFAAATSFEVLCVCSDQTVGSKGNDEAIHSVADLAFPVTSNVEEVKNFLGGAGNRVIFSTYQSSFVIAAAQADPAIPAFDLAVADEAHRCAGKVGSDFTAILDNAQIRSTKRLFATATPRTYSSTVHKAAEDRGVEVVGMDNAALFGEVLYALPFGKAIENKLLTDYRVVIIVVDDPTIAQWIANRELVSLKSKSRVAPNSPLPPLGEGWDEGGEHGVPHQHEQQQHRETDSESLAAQIGLLKAIKDYDLKRIISFHSRVNRAEAFTTDMQNTLQWISDEHRPSGTLRTDFVSGNMSANKRKIKLDQLKGLNADERGVLSNARCLSEGVDVPSLDGVAFIDPRSSQVDIIQAVGRAIRLSPDKKAGTIILPVFIAAGEDATSTIEASNFKPIWEVLNALKAHDDVLACELDQIRTELGRKSDTCISADDLRKITIDLPATVDADFGGALRTYLVEQITAPWNFWFGLLEVYLVREGHCLVPALYRTADGYRLGNWVGNQRSKSDMMPMDRKARLEALPGWTWDAVMERWEEGFRHLKEFVDRESHCKFSNSYKSADGYRLGQWVGVQRAAKDKLPAERKARLEALPGWVWVANDARWAEGFRHLNDFVDQEGHCKVPQGYKTAAGYQLCNWVSTQRASIGRLDSERKARLEELHGWAWDTIEERWEEGFRYLMEFVDREGHSKVLQNCETSDGFRLGQWVSRQRQTKNSMPVERKARFESLSGWVWAERVLGEKKQWGEWFQLLKEFADREGSCRVPNDYKTADGYRLGSWVMNQRTKKNVLTPECKARLEKLSGWSWNALDDDVWEERFCSLQEFVDREGHCKILQNYVTADGCLLGAWVARQRAAKDSMYMERKARLEALPGWRWNALEDAWEEGFLYLKEFADREGHCKVPDKYKTAGGYRLGQWVGVQRVRKNRMIDERKVRLEGLSGWAWRAK